MHLQVQLTYMTATMSWSHQVYGGMKLKTHVPSDPCNKYREDQHRMHVRLENNLQHISLIISANNICYLPVVNVVINTFLIDINNVFLPVYLCSKYFYTEQFYLRMSPLTRRRTILVYNKK